MSVLDPSLSPLYPVHAPQGRQQQAAATQLPLLLPQVHRDDQHGTTMKDRYTM